MIGLAFFVVLFIYLGHILGYGIVLALISSPAWVYGLFKAIRHLRRILKKKQEEQAAQAQRLRLEREEAVRRAMQDSRNRLIRELKSLASPRLMITLDPVSFERYVLKYFSLLGFDCEDTAVSGDHGIDGVIKRGGEMSLIQCKRYLQAVGEPEIRDFLGTVTKFSARCGYFVTTSTFNLRAREFAEGTSLVLIDGDELAQRINELKCLDPATNQVIELPLFNSDHWHEFSFIVKESREPLRGNNRAAP
jgi:restriction endonuclease Mrr